MRKLFHFLILGTIIASLCSCSTSSSPTVTKEETVEAYNAKMEFTNYASNGTAHTALAPDYYSYVIWDEHKNCVSPMGCFRIPKLNSGATIKPSDHCINCGKRWDEHENF